MAPDNNDQDHDHYETHEYAGDRAADTYRAMTHMPGEDRSTRTRVQDSITASQAQRLAPEVRMGDDRAIGDTPNWHGYTSQQLYDAATEDNSPTTADSLGRAFNDGGNRLAEAANGLFEAVTALEGAWSGVAADSARDALVPLAQAAGQAGQTAQMMGVQMSRQSVAATEVRKLPPPMEFDQQRSLQAMVTGGPAAMQADLKAQKEAADAVRREQIAYLDAYTRAMTAVDAQTPSFVPPPTRTIDPDAGGGPRVTANPVSVPETGGVLHGDTSTGAPTGGYVGIAPGSAAGEGVHQDGGFDPGDLTIPGTVPGTSTAGYTPGAPPTSTPTAGLGGGVGGASSAPAAGAGGFGGGFGNFGGGAGGTGGAAGGGAGGTGANSGTGNTGPRGGGAFPAGTAPARGAGAGGMGAGGRRADGEDDDERDRPSYLLEGDPDSAFGSDAMTAPSVIGEDGDD